MTAELMPSAVQEQALVRPPPQAMLSCLSSAVTVEWFNAGTTGERGLGFQARLQLHPSGPTPAGKGGAEDAVARFHSRLEGPRAQTQNCPSCSWRQHGLQKAQDQKSEEPRQPGAYALRSDPVLRSSCATLRGL